MIKQLALLTIIMICCCSCSREVLFESEPSGARVYLDGSLAGYTPVKLKVSSGVRKVRFEAEGYPSRTLNLGKQFDSRGLLWILFPPVLLVPASRTSPESNCFVIFSDPFSAPISGH